MLINSLSPSSWVLTAPAALTNPQHSTTMPAVCRLAWTANPHKSGLSSFNQHALGMGEIIRHLVKFVSRLWQIHIFGEENTRTTAVFFIKYLRSLGFNVTNDIFAANAWYFRNALVRANYSNLQKGIHETTIYLEQFLRNLLLGEANTLKNRYLHVDWKEKTVHSEGKQYIEQYIQPKNSILELLDTTKVTEKTKNNIITLYKTFGVEKIFGRTEVAEVLSITVTPATTLIKRMLAMGIIGNVHGLGKGKYRFALKE